MASRKGKLLASVIKIVKPILTKMTLEKKRTGHDLLGILHHMPEGIEIENAENCPVKAEWIIPKGAKGGRVILFIHGGSYLTGSVVASRLLTGMLSKTTGCKVLSFEYRLAPEHRFPGALEDCEKTWNYLTGVYAKPKEIIIVGESAGGGLAFALAMKMRDEGRILPLGLVGLCSWADLTETSQSHVTLEHVDPVLNSDELRAAAVKYSAGECLKNPYISPVFGDFKGLPETLLQVGTREILLDDSILLEKKLQEAGVPVSLRIYEDMWHIWHGFDVPEAHEALKEIKDFISGIGVSSTNL